MTNSESKSAVEAQATTSTESFTASIRAAVIAARTPRELLEQVAPLVREYFGVWMAIATMPHREQLTVIDAQDSASMVDPELLRIQMLRSGQSPTATTIRLADGTGVRALQVAFGEGDSAVGIGMVHAPEHAPDAITQVQQLKLLAVASEMVFNAMHAIKDVPTSFATAAPLNAISTTASDGSRVRLREFHRSLKLADTAYAIAAESAWMVDCDRVCLLVRQGVDYRLMAVTGVDVIDRRGNESSTLEQFAKCCVALRQPLVYPSTEELPPQVEMPMGSYLDQSLVQSGIIVPIFEPTTPSQKDEGRQDRRPPIGMIVFERFRGRPLEALTPAMQAICDEAAIALQNAREHESIFLLPVWRTMGQLVSPAKRYRTLGVCGVLVSAIIASLLVQVDYKVTATGTIEPAIVQNLFATTDGVVTRLHVQDGQMVAKGDLLIELENAELQRQAEEITGEIHTVTEKLAAINAAMTSSRPGRKDSASGEADTIEHRHLETQLKSLKAQQEVVLAEKARLAIHSPISGQVVGWRLSQRLEQRPVSRGHRLFSVVDTTGPKRLKLSVPDRESAALIQHASQAGGPLSVDFILAAEPDRTIQASVEEIATATRVDAQGLNVLDVTAKVDDDAVISPKIGTDVTAAIHCGRRSVLATWFGDIARFYHRHVRFYFA